MKIKKWCENHIALIVGVVLAVIMILIFIWVFMQLQYCFEHPSCDWCRMTNATGVGRSY